jgi:hypothetical protein
MSMTLRSRRAGGVCALVGCVCLAGCVGAGVGSRVDVTVQAEQAPASLAAYDRVEVVEFRAAPGVVVPDEAREGLETAIAQELSALPGIVSVQVMLGPSATAAGVLCVQGRLVAYEPNRPMSLAVQINLTDARTRAQLGAARFTAVARRAAADPTDLHAALARALAQWLRPRRRPVRQLDNRLMALRRGNVPRGFTIPVPCTNVSAMGDQQAGSSRKTSSAAASAKRPSTSPTAGTAPQEAGKGQKGLL